MGLLEGIKGEESVLKAYKRQKRCYCMSEGKVNGTRIQTGTWT